MQKNQTLKISLCTINNDEREISVPTTYTGYHLKAYIYTNVTQSLKIHQMKLCYAGMKIEDDKLLSAYKIGSTIKMIQAKCDIDEVPGLIVSYEQDPIGLEEITARMPCGHVIGRDCMTQFIRSLVQTHLFTITCPSYKPNDQKCACEWDYALCRKVGVFTKQETIQFQTGLRENWIRKNTIECPNCRYNLLKAQLKMDRVKCSRCNYDFCACFLKNWLSNNNDHCGNQCCYNLNSFLEKSPWTRIFELKQNDKIIKIKCPMHRACPNCYAGIIESTNGSKDMRCRECDIIFCWICLGVKQNNNWKCGSHWNCCGPIAKTQVLPINKLY